MFAGDSNSENNPPFKSLDAPIKKLVENLDNRIIPTITNYADERIKVIKEAFVVLIIFLDDEIFDQISSLNTDYTIFLDVSEESLHELAKINIL